MTDKQINAAIAEACGRKRRPNGDWYPDNGTAGTQAILNYCKDLNAMHEAEMKLTKEQSDDYVARLFDSCYELAFATASQRAEAFLRTLGKWEDGK